MGFNSGFKGLIYILFSVTVDEINWEIMVVPERPLMKTWRMRIVF